MAKVVEVQLVAKTDEAVAGVNKVDQAVKKTAKTAKKASKELSGMQQIGNEAVKGLDKLTGGLASKLVAVGKAAKLSGKAMKTALISSGIGLAVAAVGLLVEYWDEIGEALGFINKDLERQVELNNQNLDAVGVRLRNIQTLIELRKREGKDVDLLLKKEKELTEQKKQAFVTSIQDQALLVNRLKLKQQEGKLNEEDTKELIKQENVYLDLLNNFNKFKSDLLKPVKEVVKKDTSAADAADVEAAERARLEAIERIRKGLIDTEAEERAEKLRLINEDYTEQIELAAKFYGTNSIKILELKAAQKKAEDEQQAEFDEQDKAKQDKINQEAKDKEKKRLEDIQKIVNDATELSELEKIEKDRLAAQTELDLLGATWIEKARINAFYMQQIADKEKEINDEKLDNDTKIADAKTDLQNKLVGNVQNAVGAIGNIFEKGTAASKGAALAEIAIGTGIGFINALDIAQKSAKGTGPAAAFAFPIFYASQIAAVLGAVSQAKNILSTVKGGGGSGSTPTAPTGGGSAPQPPAFNIVGASGETQLADAIGSQTQRPARAYVVSNDVTTAQEMDRNIIEGASIG